jgi:cysteine desulfurase
LVETIPEIRWTGDPVRRAPHIVSCVIPGVAGDVLAQSVSALGVAISVGSACHASSGEPSHVLRAMGASTVEAACAVRLSVGLSTSDEDIGYAIEVISECVRRLRSILLAGRETPLLETVERIANDISSSQEVGHEP